MGIKWTSSAINDIENIREYINKDSEIYSERFIGKIVKAVERLSIFPDMGRKVKETKSDYIREIIFQNYRIIYRIGNKASQITIITIFHCGRDMTQLEKHPWEII